MKWSKLAFLPTVIGLAVLSACGQSALSPTAGESDSSVSTSNIGRQDNDDPATLTSAAWVMVGASSNGVERVVPSAGEEALTMEFYPGSQMGGTYGCNYFHVPVDVGPGTLKLAGDIWVSAVGCSSDPDLTDIYPFAFKGIESHWSVQGSNAYVESGGTSFVFRKSARTPSGG